MLELFFAFSILKIQMDELHPVPIVADLHCDALYMVLRGKKDLITQSNSFEVDIPRLKQGGVNLQVFAIFVEPRTKGYYHYVSRAIEKLKEICREDSADIAVALDPADIARIVAGGKIAALLAIEGGHALEDDLAGDDYGDALSAYFDAGVRILTITHNKSNEFADAALDSLHQPNNGLSSSGQALIENANRLGMIIDVSHSSDKTFFDIIRASRAPVIASHSNARAICSHPRNLTDDQLKAIAKNGGVIGVNFHSSFLRSDGKRATIADIIKHIDHIIALVGDDYVVFGSDFDGMIKPPTDLKDVSQLPALIQALRTAGYSESTISKLSGKNFLRVFTAVSQIQEKER